MLTFDQLSRITQGRVLQFVTGHPLHHLLLDSRKLVSAEASLFFALRGERHEGHDYLQELYRKGVRQFVVEFLPETGKKMAATAQQSLLKQLPEANILQVPDTLLALQQIAAFHRSKFSVPVLAITGSNGKTIVKEWLAQLLSPDEVVVKSPRSYNSQTGVPLSVWQMHHQHTFGIFEAGISKPDEMPRLRNIIQPTIGIFTNIGTAHNEGFVSVQQKISEKLSLFRHVKLLIYCSDQKEVHAEVTSQKIPSFTWARNGKADLEITDSWDLEHSTRLELKYKGKPHTLLIPFADDASTENCLHCIALLLSRGVAIPEIQQRLLKLSPVGMRLELKEALHDCYLIDDSYNNDLAGLAIALDFLVHQHQRPTRTVILSDLLQSGLCEDELYKQVSLLLEAKHVDRIIGVGPVISRHETKFRMRKEFYPSTENFLQNFDLATLRSETILVKGARVFRFEKIVEALQKRVHGTLLEVNLDALVHNLNYYRARLKPTTKIMVMVKAFSYGSGTFEIANLLQYHRIDYVAVAYTDEGVALRQNGIQLPVMVMNPASETFSKLLEHRLEPEIYSLPLLRDLIDTISVNPPVNGPVPVHLKLDTGMHRLGFEQADLKEMLRLVQANQNLRVASVFSHLAGADEALYNDFSQEQIRQFRQMAAQIEKELGYFVMKHILNSAGIVRFPEHQLDMVRLGIGLYGIEASGQHQQALQPVSMLRTHVSQVKHVKKGDTVGYSRKGIAEQDLTIATIAVGYADGYDRRFGNGVGHVLIHGKPAPLIGNVCMDMCMVNVTGMDVKAGDQVIVFGPELPLTELSKKIGTIPYELLTNVSARVKRVFYSE